MVEISSQAQGVYKKVSSLVENWLILHKGETFDLDTICRHLQILERDNRNYVTIILSKLVHNGKLEKSNRLYRYIDNTIEYMNWIDSVGAKNLSLKWPLGRDNSQFGFNGRIFVPEKGLVVIAGVTNTGKSVFCRNFLYQNMDAYHCVYYSSETSQDDFADYASRMTWANPLKEDGTPKFDLVWRDKDFKDVIDPNAINIIDWLNIYDNFYSIGEVLDKMKSKLDTGILLVAIQKDPVKGLGVGGMWAEHKASVYMTMDYGRLTVEKAKKWEGWNPNKHSWGFDIIDRGTHFNNIRLLKKCGFCWNGKKNNSVCTVCKGTGFVDDDEYTEEETF